MSQKYPTSGDKLPQIHNTDEKQNIALISKPASKSASPSKVNDDIEAAAFGQPGDIKPLGNINEKTKAENSFATANENDKLTPTQKSTKEKKTGCFGKNGLIRNIFNGGSTLMSYSASTLSIHETRSEQPKVSTTVVNTSCWTFIIIVFLGLIALNIINTVGKFKNVVLTEEIEIEQTMVLDQTTFPLHNFLKFGPMDDLKNRIGSVLYQQSVTSSNRRRNLETTGTANDLTVDTCESASTQNYFDAAAEVCYTCPDYYAADTTALSCIQKTCAEEQVYAKNGNCENCPSYFRPNSDYTQCINDAASCTTTQILSLTGQCTDCEVSFRANSEQTVCINDLATCSPIQKLSSTGYCEDCANQFRASSDRLSCIQDACTDIQIYTAIGKCQNCETYSRSNEAKTECVSDKDSCLETQYLDSKGFCVNCEDNFRGNTEKTQCINDVLTCISTQYLNSAGYCTDCETYYRGSQNKLSCINDKDSCSAVQKLTSDGYCADCEQYSRANAEKTDCITDTCEAREFKDITGVCSECADYTYPSDDDKSCVFDTCTGVQKLLVDGTCQDCQAYNRADETGKICRPDTCDDTTQILITDGTCSTCESFTHPNDDKRTCISDTCSATQILIEDGTCQQCADFSRADETGKICRADTCNDQTQIVIQDGTCSDCQDYTHPDGANRECIADPCDYTTQIILLDGSCQACENFFRPDATDQAKNCIQDDCDTNQNEIHRSDGTCTTCQDYSYPGQFFNQTSGQGICVTDSCENSTQILMINGTCKTCEEFKHPDDQNLACISDSCNGTQILVEDGTCQQCADYSRADEAGRVCRPDTCDNSVQILLIDGSCEKCAEFSKPDSDNRQCTADECDALTQILKPDGNCETCPEYSRPDEFNRVCLTDDCDYLQQILVLNGTCQSCPSHFYPDWDQVNPAKECKQDSCDHSNTETGRQIVNAQGICEKCPDYTRPKDEDIAKECVADPCDYLTQILLADGTCQSCETHTYPDWNQVDPAKICIKDTCDHSEDGGREFLNTAGKCEQCPQYTYPKPVSETYAETRDCIFDTCDVWSQILQTTGICQTCSPYSYPEGYLTKPADPTTSLVSKSCIELSCNKEREIMNEQRQCETCADFFYPDVLGLTCIQDTCTTLSQILLSSGKCQDCPQFTFPDGSNRECIQETCDHTYQIVSSIGSCQDCPAYSYPDTSLLDGDTKPTSCFELGCNPATEIMTKPAPHVCQPCQEYSYPNVAGDKCMIDQCDNRSQILGLNGKCSDCGEYTYPNGQNLQCISDDCDFTKQVLNRQGSCTTCAPYQYPGGDQRTCISVDCNSRSQILNLNNECETCSEYSYPSSDGTTCKSDTCDTTIEVVAKTGKCFVCADYTYPNPDDAFNRECMSDACSDDETLRRNGRCVLKSQLFEQDKPNENAIRTQLRIEGDIADMQTEEAQTTFKNNLASAMGFDSKYIQIQSIYAGSIVVVYDLVADENLSKQQLAQASQDAFKSGAVEGAVGTVLDVTQKDPSGTELLIVKDGEAQPIPEVAVVLTEADINIPQVVIDPTSALANFISNLKTEDLKNFLCKNYYITLLVLNYKTETKQMKFSGCEFIESDTPNEFVLHHYFTENDKISEFKVKRSPFSTQEITFQQSADLTGINVESQQFVTIVDQKKSKDQQIQIKYPSIVEEEYTYTLFSTNRKQTFGATYLPPDSKLHLRQEKTVKKDGNATAIVFFNELGDMHPQYYSSIQRYGTTFELDLKYDFVKKIHTDVYYTLYDAIFLFIIIFPVVGFTLAGLIFLLNIVYFYQHLTQLIKRRYKDAQNWQAAQKYLKKFRKIHSALEGMQPYAHILNELETYLNIEWDKCTYEETLTQTKKMETLDSMLPNLDDLEINLSKFTMSEAEKAKQQEIETIMDRRTQLSVIDILDLVKKRVSIFGVYQLYDDLEMKDANLRSEIKISNAKLEFLYRTLDRKSHKAKRTHREKTN